MHETPKHREAFEKYYDKGHERSLGWLAGDQGVSLKTVKKWSAEFHWQERIKQRDMEHISQGDSRKVDELERQLTALQDRLDTIEQEFKAHRSWSGHRRF